MHSINVHVHVNLHACLHVHVYTNVCMYKHVHAYTYSTCTHYPHDYIKCTCRVPAVESVSIAISKALFIALTSFIGSVFPETNVNGEGQL